MEYRLSLTIFEVEVSQSAELGHGWNRQMACRLRFGKRTLLNSAIVAPSHVKSDLSHETTQGGNGLAWVVTY